MLRVSLIGGISATKLNDVLSARFDHLETTIFETVSDFYSTSEMRNLTVDRLIILQDAFNGPPNINLLTSLNLYLSQKYASTRIVTLSNKDDILELFSSVFISPLAVHIDARSLKQKMVEDIIELKHEELRERYGYASKRVTGDSINEVLQDNTQGKTGRKKPEKKSSGLFSLFSRKPKKPKPRLNTVPKPGTTEIVNEQVPLPSGEEEFTEVVKFPEGTDSSSETMQSSDMDTEEDFTIDGMPVFESPPLNETNESGAFDEFEGFDNPFELDSEASDGVASASEVEDEDDFSLDIIGQEEQEDIPSQVDTGSLSEDSVDAPDWATFSTPEQNEEIEVDDTTLINDENSNNELLGKLEQQEELELEWKEPVEVTPYFDELEAPFGLSSDSDSADDTSFIHPDSGLVIEDELDSEEPTSRSILLSAVVDTAVDEAKRKFDTLKDEAAVQVAIPDFTGVTAPKVEAITETVDEDVLSVDMESLEKEYDEQNTKVVDRVVEVEKVVEKVVTVEKPIYIKQPVQGGVGGRRGFNSGVRTLIFTGDRKSGVTKTALQSSLFYAKSSSVLYVDFDIKRHGSLLHFGLNNVIEEDTRVQNGLIGLRGVQQLPYLVYNYASGGFDALISEYGAEYEDTDLYETQRVLTTQRVYSTVIIDCPLENLHYLKDILLYSEIVVCTESDIHSVLSTVLALSEAFDSETQSTFLFNNSKYLLTREPNPEKFRKNIEYVAEMFSLDESEFNWGNVPVLGTSKDLVKILTRL